MCREREEPLFYHIFCLSASHCESSSPLGDPWETLSARTSVKHFVCWRGSGFFSGSDYLFNMYRTKPDRLIVQILDEETLVYSTSEGEIGLEFRYVFGVGLKMCCYCL